MAKKRIPLEHPGVFLKEVAALFGSIIVFIIITALALYALAWLVTE